MSFKIRQILLVEDNPGDVRLTEEAFKEHGNGEFELHHASSFRDALETMAQKRVDAVLMDLFLPDVECLEGILKMTQAHPHVPVVAMSSFMNETVSSFALQMGARAYLSKTDLDWENLVGTVRRQTGVKMAGAVSN